MRDLETATLFNAMAKILYNQDKIMKHLGINKVDYEYGYDSSTYRQAEACEDIARDYEND